MVSKYKILALFGKSGAGKDTIQKWLVRTQNINGIISCTTRPKRDNEIDGVDYHFISNEEFAQKVLDCSMLEATDFNNWFYGTPLSALQEDKINVGVFNIHGIECLLQDSRLEVLPVYIQCFDKIRLLRCLKRENIVDCHEVCRRFLTDEKDFENIEFNYITYDNSCDNDEYFGILNLPKINNFIKDINN